MRDPEVSPLTALPPSSRVLLDNFRPAGWRFDLGIELGGLETPERGFSGAPEGTARDETPFPNRKTTI